jgi:hypothetical protein
MISLVFSPANDHSTIAYLSLPPELWDTSEQAAHYHILGVNVWGFSFW